MGDVIKARKLVAMASPAGGVGKSTLCKELAVVFGSTKVNDSPIKVCLVDANIEFGSQRAFFGIASYRYSICDWMADYRENLKTCDAMALDRLYSWEYIEKYLVFSKDRNVYLLLAPDKPSSMDMTVQEADMLYSTLLKFFDVVIVDTPNSLNGATEAALVLATDTFFVINDDERSAYKMGALRSSLAGKGLLPRVRETACIVFNRYNDKKTERYLQPYMVESRTGFPLFVTVPNYKYMYYYNNRKQAAACHNTPVREPILKIAHKILPDVIVRKDTIGDRMKRRFSKPD